MFEKGVRNIEALRATMQTDRAGRPGIFGRLCVELWREHRHVYAGCDVPFETCYGVPGRIGLSLFSSHLHREGDNLTVHRRVEVVVDIHIHVLPSVVLSDHDGLPAFLKRYRQHFSDAVNPDREVLAKYLLHGAGACMR